MKLYPHVVIISALGRFLRVLKHSRGAALVPFPWATRVIPEDYLCRVRNLCHFLKVWMYNTIICTSTCVHTKYKIQNKKHTWCHLVWSVHPDSSWTWCGDVSIHPECVILWAGWIQLRNSAGNRSIKKLSTPERCGLCCSCDFVFGKRCSYRVFSHIIVWQVELHKTKQSLSSHLVLE